MRTGTTRAERPLLDVILLLLLFLVAFTLSIRAAMIRDQDAERAEDDAQRGVRTGGGWIPDGSDGEALP